MLAKLREAMEEREKNTEHYRNMLKRTMKDGLVTPDEEELLGEFRNRYGISIEEHNKWLNEV